MPSPIDSPLAAVKDGGNDHAQARTEALLRSGEPNFEHIVDNIPGLVFTTTPNGALEFVNRRVLEYFGRTLAELREWATTDSIHPDDVPSVLAARKRVIEAGVASESPAHRLRRADGTYRWFMSRTSPVRDGDGRIVRWYSLLTDIEDRKRAEELLRAREDHLRRVVDGIPGFVFSATADGDIEFVNQQLLEYTGRTFEELKGWSTSDLVHPDDLPRVLEERRRSIETGQSQNVEHRVRGADGRYRWFEVRRLPERDADGRIVRWYLVLVDIDDLKTTTGELEHALAEIKLLKDQLYEENLALRDEVDRVSMFEEIVGASQALRKALSLAVKVAPTNSSVLITGETGTGKELIARAIHKRSPRAAGAFVSVNCAALPSSLILSELFGHEKGAFTGAIQRRVGRFELAHRGTLFLDEVGELPLDVQSALLRVLQEKEFERVGGTQTVRVDVRVVAATNRDLDAATASGAFRSDLLYRLNVFPVDVPPLRARKDDVLLLLEYFVRRFATEAGKTFDRIDKRTIDLFQAYDWPGNIRELQNVVERSVIVSPPGVFRVDEAWLSRSGSGTASRMSIDNAADDSGRERKLIEAALAATHGRVSGPRGAAAKLRIPPTTLEYKIKRLRIRKSQFKLA
jgi:formate hydrogenlyase transcriptional activator